MSETKLLLVLGGLPKSPPLQRLYKQIDAENRDNLKLVIVDNEPHPHLYNLEAHRYDWMTFVNLSYEDYLTQEKLAEMRKYKQIAVIDELLWKDERHPGWAQKKESPALAALMRLLEENKDRHTLWRLILNSNPPKYFRLSNLHINTKYITARMATMGVDTFSQYLLTSAYSNWPWRSVKQVMHFKVNGDHVLTTLFNASPFNCEKEPDIPPQQPKCKTEGCEFFSGIGGYCSECTTLQAETGLEGGSHITMKFHLIHQIN